MLTLSSYVTAYVLGGLPTAFLPQKPQRKRLCSDIASRTFEDECIFAYRVLSDRHLNGGYKLNGFP